MPKLAPEDLELNVMTKRILRLFMVLLAATLASAQPKGGTVDFPCNLSDYRIAARDSLQVHCDGKISQGLTANVTLYRVQDESVVYPGATGKDNVTINAAPEAHWLTVPLPKALDAGQDYEVRFSGSYKVKEKLEDPQPNVTVTYSSTRFRFTTRAVLSEMKNPGQPTVRLFSNLPMEFTGSARLIDHTHGDKQYKIEQGAGVEPTDDSAAIGQILITPAPPPGTLGQKLEVIGVKDTIFQQVPSVKAAKPSPPTAAPKSKDAASIYLNVLHQAGVGSPIWITYAKLAPVLGILPGGFLLTPSLDIDVGDGQIEKNKTNDLINPKVALTKVLRNHSNFLEGIGLTSAISYESNRAQDKQNILFDGDSRLYIFGLQNTQAQRTLDAFVKARAKNPKIQMAEVAKARFGYKIQLFTGVEIGNSLTVNTAKSSDKSSSVAVPTYAIRRVRPRMVATFEFGRFTASITATPRYLANTEFVTRETDTLVGGKTKKSIYLSTVSGWRGYGELSLNYAFDAVGHYALNMIYKTGSQPPNFDRVNMVQSGLLIRF